MTLSIKKPKKILLASGCSYTDEKFKSMREDVPEEYRDSYKMWPAHIAEQLDLECVNVGKNGASNQNIYNSIIDSIMKYGDRIDTVCVLWSGWDRFVFANDLVLVISHYMSQKIIKKEKDSPGYNWVADIGLDDVIEKWIGTYWFQPELQLTNQIKSTLTFMISLALICEQRNIKYIYAQGVNALNLNVYNAISDELAAAGNLTVQNKLKRFSIESSFLKNPIFSQLERRKNKIVGWPFEPKIGGYYLDDHRIKSIGSFWKDSHKNNLYRISEKDWHPNKEGQKIISQIFLEKYEEVYA